MMDKTISDDSENQQNIIYNLLPEARPLHLKTPTQPKSAYQFTSTPAPDGHFPEQPAEPMQQIPGDRNAGTHELGPSLKQLFKVLVYQSYQEIAYTEDNNKFATCAVGDGKEGLKAVEGRELEEGELQFESRFQSGNLAFVSRANRTNEYNLALQRDTNSLATCQWYYFYIENKSNLGTYTFNIVNLIKSYSAYQNGMKPCVFSTQAGKGWRRDGFNIGYQRNSIPYRGERNYFTFKFSYNFVHKNDRVYFAYSYPYTFTRLQNLICQLEMNHPSLIQVKCLTKTLKDNPVNILSITNPSPHSHSEEHRKINKDLIMICARVHPGQTNGSFACEGLIRFLLQNSDEANNLRTHYTIKIIPFLNPDGVIHGNYRTSLSGNDLNRKWKRPDKSLHPEIYAIKKYLNETNHRKALFIDLHGHSKKRSSFMYGCLNKQNPYLCKQFPFILSKNGHHFCYFNCNFSTPASREGTSRINVWKEFKVDYSYTMEISFCGPVGNKSQFLIRDYLQMGASLGRIMSTYFCGKVYNTNQIHHKSISHLLKELYNQEELLNQGVEESSGSESGQEDKVQLADKREEKLSNFNKESTVELNSLLTKYLNETKTKWPKRDGFKSRNSSSKNQQKSEPNLRVRRELAPSRISIQKIDLSEQISNPYMNFGFMRGNIRLTSRELKGHSIRDSIKGLNHRNSYGPYSSNKVKLNQKIGQEHSLMLPKVLRQEQIKYRKYRRNECRFEISLSHQEPQLKQSSRAGNHQGSREISLAQKIFQTTHRQLHETGRYWVRNS